jgi:hypothetical protein
MKHQDDADRATRASRRCHRDWIRIVESLYDMLDAGKSVEELTVAFDIGAAGGAIPEGLPEILREALEFIRDMREQGADRNEVMNLLTRERKGTV